MHKNNSQFLPMPIFCNGNDIILGAEVELFYSLDGKILTPGAEVNITGEELLEIEFSARVLDVMPVKPAANVTAYYPDVGILSDVAFSYHAVENRTFEIDENTGNKKKITTLYKYTGIE